MNTPQPNQTADIVVTASVAFVYAHAATDKAKAAGFNNMRMREEYSDTLRSDVRTFAQKHDLTVDWSRDW